MMTDCVMTIFFQPIHFIPPSSWMQNVHAIRLLLSFLLMRFQKDVSGGLL